MKLLYASKNPAKLSYMNKALKSLPIQLSSLGDFPKLEDAPENGTSPLENAHSKALFYYERFKVPLFSCDSGLYFEGLPDELQPGTQVRRIHGQSLNDSEMISYYASLAGRYGHIKAHYQSAICLVLSPEQIIEADDEGLCSESFWLVEKPHGKRVPGFPLDSLSVDIRSGKYYYDLLPERYLDTAKPDSFVSFFRKALRL